VFFHGRFPFLQFSWESKSFLPE
jgi:hypothetical protein